MTRPIFDEMREWSLYQPVTVGPVACVHPIPAAHTAPPAISVMPAMNRIVSARVSIQLLRMLRLNRWTAPGSVVSNR